MPVSQGFHPDALVEYAEAAGYLLHEVSPRVAEQFMTAVEAAVAAVTSAPTRWRVIEAPDIRRYVITRFPYVIYYRWEQQCERVTIYAVMHCSRDPGYWHERIRQSGQAST